MPINAYPSAAHALSLLLAMLGLDRSPGCSAWRITGDGPVDGSPHRIAEASAVALLAGAVGIADGWRRRGGRPQHVSIDLSDAWDAVNSGRHLRQWGHVVSPWYGMYSPLSGFHRTGDGGFVYMAGARRGLRDGLLSILKCAHEPAAIARALRDWSARGFEDACAEHGLAGCRVRTPQEWRGEEQGRWLATQPVIGIERIGDAPPPPPLAPGDRPLSGLKVLEMAHILAGPVAGRTLAAQGADVLRISSPKVPDDIALMLDSGFGKRAAFVDLDEEGGPATFDRLIGEADVFIQSYRAASIERRGVGPERLASWRPGIVYLDVSCYGGGPWRDRVGFDPNAQAVTGISKSEGGAGHPALPTTELLCDLITGYLGVAGVLAALARREREGGSYLVRVSLARTAMWIQDVGLKDRALAPVTRERPPSLARMDSPFGELTYLAPPVDYSETPANWALPPQPAGASAPVWKD